MEILHVEHTPTVMCQEHAEMTYLVMLIIHVPYWRGREHMAMLAQDNSGLIYVWRGETVETPTTQCLVVTVRSESLRTLALCRGKSSLVTKAS